MSQVLHHKNNKINIPVLQQFTPVAGNLTSAFKFVNECTVLYLHYYNNNKKLK